MYLDRPVGIDLGTTNSAIAMLEPGGRDLLIYTDRFRRKIVPSVVGWDPGKEDFIVGFPAWNRRGMDPEPVQSIKRKMGRQTTVAVGPHQLDPETISARILSEVTASMQGYAGEKLEGYQLEVERAVITVPAYFDAPQIDATRRAGELAGLEVLGLLQEPTAAAMYYAWKHGVGDACFLVYDLGGGTFDVSVIRCLMGEYQVLSIHGDNFLGGDDFDRRFAEHLRQHLVKEGYALDLDIQNNEDDATRFLVLTRIAQEVKEALSTSEFQYIGRRGIFDDQSGNPVTLEMEISRGEWEGLMRSYVDQSISCCRQALKIAEDTAGVTLADIDHILMVGGSTRVPMVQRAVSEAFIGQGLSKAQALSVDEPDTCVSLGAAIHAANLGGLSIGDHSQDIGVNITSSLTTRGETTRLSGQVIGSGAAGVAEVELIDVTDAANPDSYELVPVKEGRFKIADIELPDPGTYPFNLALRSGSGQSLLSLPIAFYRGGDARSTGSALSNPTVLAKDIYLEVVRLGRPDRQILLETGTSLPTEARFRFYTADQSGAVILRLMQNRLPIRTIHLEVPADLPLQTPVDLKLNVDDKMVMTAEGGVADQAFWAQIEPPPPADERNLKQIEGLLEEADRVGSALWGNDASYFRDKAQYLKAGIREAARTDPDKLQVLAGRLADMLEDYRSEDRRLTPSYDRFERILNLVRRRVFRDVEERLLGLSADDWAGRLATVETSATEAYHRGDQATWSRCYSQIQAIWESLAQDDSRYTNPNSADYLVRSLLAARHHVDELKENLAMLVLSDNEETRKVQQREQLSILDALNSEVIEPLEGMGADPGSGGEVRAQLEKIHGALRRLDKRLERLPSLGLVSG